MSSSYSPLHFNRAIVEAEQHVSPPGTPRSSPPMRSTKQNIVVDMQNIVVDKNEMVWQNRLLPSLPAGFALSRRHS